MDLGPGGTVVEGQRSAWYVREMVGGTSNKHSIFCTSIPAPEFCMATCWPLGLGHSGSRRIGGEWVIGLVVSAPPPPFNSSPHCPAGNLEAVRQLPAQLPQPHEIPKQSRLRLLKLHSRQPISDLTKCLCCVLCRIYTLSSIANTEYRLG